ncbi:MAG: tripartite tricarboxylate transporter TctB family protein [Nitrospinae bacterium]|nr:tripartite tricarboxylate transporter TctB family protein [Nitrospinota bacterium]
MVSRDGPTDGMRHGEIIVSGVLLALAGVVVINAIDLGIGWGMSGPASGFFPFCLALILGVPSTLHIVQILRTSAAGQPFASPPALGGVLKIGGATVAYIFLIEFLGLYVASAFFLACFMRWLGGQRWGTCVAVGLGFPAGIFVLFEKWFLIPLPKGIVERFLSF